MKTLKYAKMIRIRRLGRFIRKLNVPTNVKEGFNLVKLLLYLTLSIHISACLWFTITQLEDHHDEEENKEINKKIFSKLLKNEHHSGHSDEIIDIDNAHWIPPYHFIDYRDVSIYDDKIR